MKRYLVFAGAEFYASGGGADFTSAFDVLEDAVAHGCKIQGTEIKEYTTAEWWHVFDAEQGRVVCGIDGCYCGALPDGAEDLSKSTQS